MSDTVEVHIDPDDAVFEAYLKEPQPAFLLREDLSPRQLFILSQTYCIVEFDIDGKRRFGILSKIYRHVGEDYTQEQFDRTLEWFQKEE